MFKKLRTLFLIIFQKVAVYWTNYIQNMIVIALVISLMAAATDIGLRPFSRLVREWLAFLMLTLFLVAYFYTYRMFQSGSIDSLTSLPNRGYLQRRINRDIQNPIMKEGVVLFLDLDGFNTINDSLGHAVGDDCIARIAEILRKNIPVSSLLSRMGGDEFVLWLPQTNHPAGMEIAGQILEKLSKPQSVSGYELHITASIGISFFPQDGEDGETLIRRADNALQMAKKKGKNIHQIYYPNMTENSFKRLEMESYLHSALSKNEFYLEYQPKMNLKTGKIIGAEALLRWENPKLGLVPLEQFIPIAEDTGLIIPIGEWVLQEACRQNKEWQKTKGIFLQMAVNLSTIQFQYSGLLESVERILEETGLDSEWLELEITESIIMENSDIVFSILNGFKAMNISLAIDDFGTGYSSLSYLKQLPVNTLKIDKSFIKEIMLKKEDRAITNAIIKMAKSLKIKVVAEGVETKQQLQYLRTIDCHEVQGYHIGKPMPNKTFEQWFIHDQDDFAQNDF